MDFSSSVQGARQPGIVTHYDFSYLHALLMKTTTLFLAMLTLVLSMNAAEPLRLSIWGEQAPVGYGKFEQAKVTITVHLPEPDKATGMAVVICPGAAMEGKRWRAKVTALLGG